MKVPVLLLLVFAAAVSANPVEPTTPLEKAAAFYKAWGARDLSTVANLLHTESLKGHRRYVEIALLKFEKSFSEKAIIAMLGKSKAELAAFSDREFFLFTVRAGLDVADPSPIPVEAGFKLI